jgi:hypothetical protein
LVREEDAFKVPGARMVTVQACGVDGAREPVEVDSTAVLEEVDVVTDAMAQCPGNGGTAGEVCRCGDRGSWRVRWCSGAKRLLSAPGGFTMSIVAWVTFTVPVCLATTRRAASLRFRRQQPLQIVCRRLPLGQRDSQERKQHGVVGVTPPPTQEPGR